MIFIYIVITLVSGWFTYILIRAILRETLPKDITEEFAYSAILFYFTIFLVFGALTTNWFLG